LHISIGIASICLIIAALNMKRITSCLQWSLVLIRRPEIK